MGVRARVALFTIASVSLASVACVVEPPWAADPPPRSAHVITRPLPPAAPYVYLRGEFEQPGRYQLLAPARLSQAIDASGGLTRLADDRVILSRRLDDGQLRRFVVDTGAVCEGAIADPELVAEDTIDAIGRVW